MNIIKTYLEDNERSMPWLARKLDVTPATIWQWCQLTDTEIKHRLSIVHYFQLCDIIPEFKQTIKEA